MYPVLKKGKLKLKSWMKWPETISVLKALRSQGDHALFVGGCVRDSFLNKPVVDIDIATSARPPKTLRLLKKAKIKGIATGMSHGTITAVCGNKKFEITTLRQDVETYGRKAKVLFTNNWEEDAMRRDFSLNAIYSNEYGEIFDPFFGLSDLINAKVRFIGNPEARIKEDFLRILRFFRFYSLYGSGKPDGKAIRSCKKMSKFLTKLSSERVWGEMKKILVSRRAFDVISLMHKSRILAHLSIKSASIAHMKKILLLEEELQKADPIRRLASLFCRNKNLHTDISNVSKRMKLSGIENRRLFFLLQHLRDISRKRNIESWRRNGHGLEASFFEDILFLYSSFRQENISRKKIFCEKMLKQYKLWQSKKFPISGNDIISLGVSEGKRVGQILNSLKLWWIDGNFQATKTSCLQRAKKMLDTE
jgi:poly(A) polymerase